MSNFGALWDVAKPLFPATSNPQGTLALGVGSLAVSPCGNVYVKRGGGSTAYGWYLLAPTDQQLQFQPNFVTGAAQLTVNRNTQSLSVGPSTILNFLPTGSGVVASASPKRSYVGGYTSGVALNSFLYRLTNNTDSMPTQRIDNTVALDFQEFDLWWDVLTTPRTNSAAASTDLTTNAMRIWAGFACGSTAVQAVGATASSDTLATEWPSALNITNNLFGGAFRFSSAVEANWKYVTTNCVGGAYGQTATDMLVPVAANTLYRLRVRYVISGASLVALASVNDGTEIAITNNVGPTISIPAQAQVFQPLASVRQINGTVKSLAVAGVGMTYGVGVGLSGC